MRTAEMNFSCPKCGQEMGISDLSLGEQFTLVIACYCFQCKETLNVGFTLGYLRSEMLTLYRKYQETDGKPLRPPLAITAPIFTDQDKNFLTALRIADEDKV